MDLDVDICGDMSQCSGLAGPPGTFQPLDDGDGRRGRRSMTSHGVSLTRGWLARHVTMAV